MKSFTVAVAAAITLTFICLQQSSAVPLTEEHEQVELLGEGVAADQELQQESWKMPYTIRQQREARGCKFCCGCCGMSGCGVCCPF